MTCGTVWMFIFIVLDFIKIVVTCLVGLALGTISGAGVSKSKLETLFIVIYIQAAVLGLLNIGTLVFLGRYICCADTFEARKSAVMGITLHIVQAIVAVVFFVIVWVAIFGVDFGIIQELILATLVECGMWAYWRKTYQEHCKALAPSANAGVTIVKA